MNRLALDLSTRSTGYAIGEQKNTLITYGCITQSSSKHFIIRIKEIVKEIIQLIEKYNIKEIYCEEVQFGGTNIHTFKTLMYLQAYLVGEVYLKNSNITFTFLQPSEHRSRVGIHTGRGIKRDNLKQEAIKHVKEKYGIVVNDDIADATTLYEASFIEKDNNEINWE